MAEHKKNILKLSDALKPKEEINETKEKKNVKTNTRTSRGNRS
jgi:hypothetical protein